MDDIIPWSVSGTLLVAWLAGLTWLFAISPSPDPSQPISLTDEVISLAMFGSWLAVFTGLGARRRFGLAASIGAGLLIAGAGVLCGIAGHTGLWIPIQIGVGSGLAALGGLGMKLT
ncbi:MAG: hypothetical protein QNJ88_11335 [Acidimicrobiia bacterium]|nr:hypothetical protein [Acidimicrobiia bacterium]